MNIPLIQKFTASSLLAGNWRGSDSVNLKDFTVQEVSVPFTPKYRGLGLEVGVNVNNPMIKALIRDGMLDQFLSFVGHAYRVGQERGFKDGVDTVHCKLGILVNECTEMTMTEEELNVAEFRRFQTDQPINPLLDDKAARELFEGSNQVRSTPIA